MIEPSNTVWDELEAAPHRSGTVSRRLFPGSGHDLHAVVTLATGTRTLQFARGWRPVDELPPLVQSHAVRLDARRTDDGRRMIISVTLVDRSFADIFSVLASDVATAVAAGRDEQEATAALFDQLERWRQILEELRESGLSPSFRRGLVAELHVMGELLVGALGPRATVEGWTGPQRANQDFQYATCAVEVKSTVARHPQTLTVANERELDETGTGGLYLVHVSLDERLGGEGRSLNDIVKHLRSLLIDDTTALAIMRDRLSAYGYISSQSSLYDEPRYVVRDLSCYHVTDGFPRITEASLPDGVGGVSYSVALPACAGHQVERHHLIELLAAGAAEEPPGAQT